MKRIAIVSVWSVLMLAAAPAWCAGPLQRYALVVGANSGGSDRPKLQYAISDAEHFARVMVELGGVASGNETILRQPKLRELTDAFDTLTRRVNEAHRAGGRTEVIRAFLNRYFPEPITATPAIDLKKAQADGRAVTGVYSGSRRAESTFGASPMA